MTLEAWLSAKNRTKTQLARQIGVPVSTIARPIAEKRAPTHKIMEKIIIATNGEVLPNDWFDLKGLLGREVAA